MTGVLTQITGPIAHDVTFRNAGRVLFRITPGGQMILNGVGPREVAEALVEQWGYCYGQSLRAASEKQHAAERKLKEAQREINRLEHRCQILEEKTSRLAVPASNRKSGRRRMPEPGTPEYEALVQDVKDREAPDIEGIAHLGGHDD